MQVKFKYYLRGAGIGIIVSTIILSTASLFQDNMSDAEIIQRAMDLGMVMEEGNSGTLADMPNQGNIDTNAGTVQDDGQNEDGSDQPSLSDDGQDVDNTGKIDDTDHSDRTDSQEIQPDNPSSEDDKNKDNQSGQSDQGDNGQEKDRTGQQKDSKEKDSKENKEKTTVKIEGGDVSRAVSQKVFEAGLVDDAEEFNDYLGDHGYDNLLQPGTYHIKKGASFQQIAEMLTNK